MKRGTSRQNTESERFAYFKEVILNQRRSGRCGAGSLMIALSNGSARRFFQSTLARLQQSPVLRFPSGLAKHGAWFPFQNRTLLGMSEASVRTPQHCNCEPCEGADNSVTQIPLSTVGFTQYPRFSLGTLIHSVRWILTQCPKKPCLACGYPLCDTHVDGLPLCWEGPVYAGHAISVTDESGASATCCPNQVTRALPSGHGDPTGA